MSSRKLTLPFFPRPPEQYEQGYFAETLRAFSTYLRQMQNPGDTRNTTITLTDSANSTSMATASLYHVRDEKSSGAQGGSAAALTQQTRDLNTEKVTNIPNASLASNQVTLPPGKYWVEASAPAYDTSRHRLSFYNVTDSTYDILGSTCYSHPTYPNSQTISFAGYVEITAEKVFEVRHYTQSVKANNGLGLASNDGNIEVYTDLMIRKVG